MIENIVFSSGGIMGFGFVGAYQYIYENNLHKNIKNILGCSVGAMISLCISLGYTSNEIKGITLGMDITKMINKDNNILDIVNNYGFDNGEHMIKILKILIKKKTGNPDLTFKEHYEKFRTKLIIVGCNINKNEDEFFNYKTQPDMKLWEAIRISCSIPLVFTPYKYKDNLYVDGALNNPCPSNYFRNQDKTISFILESDITENDNVESNDFQSYLTNLIFYNLRNNKKKKKKNKNSITIILKKENEYTEFSLSEENKIKFINQGYNITKELLPIIIENTIDKNTIDKNIFPKDILKKEN